MGNLKFLTKYGVFGIKQSTSFRDHFRVKNVHFRFKNEVNYFIPNIPYIQNNWNTFYYGIMASKLNFYFCKKLIPTRIPTRIFEFEFGMQGLNLKSPIS